MKKYIFLLLVLSLPSALFSQRIDEVYCNAKKIAEWPGDNEKALTAYIMLSGYTFSDIENYKQDNCPPAWQEPNAISLVQSTTAKVNQYLQMEETGEISKLSTKKQVAWSNYKTHIDKLNALVVAKTQKQIEKATTSTPEEQKERSIANPEQNNIGNTIEIFLSIIGCIIFIPLAIWGFVKLIGYIIYSLRKAWLKAEIDAKK